VKNSLVALLEALCARNLFFRFVNLEFFLTFGFPFLCVRKACVSNKAFLLPLSSGTNRTAISEATVICTCDVVSIQPLQVSKTFWGRRLNPALEASATATESAAVAHAATPWAVRAPVSSESH